MKFRIPFTISNIDKLKRRRHIFNIRTKKFKKLQQFLTNNDINLTSNDYLSICFEIFILSFIVFYVIATTLFVLMKIKFPFLVSFSVSSVFSLFIFLIQIIYPKVYDSRRIRDIEKNLIHALQDMLVQLNSGIPLFNILINISSSEYGSLSEEFKKAVKKINSGFPQIEVLEELGERNSSFYFKRTLWQLSNGMRAGSDITIVIEESIKTLNEEQIVQIQNYGNKLNPLIMFYMVISIILPALSISLLTVLASMINLAANTTTILFVSLFVFTIIIQIMFLGVIRSVRPTLL